MRNQFKDFCRLAEEDDWRRFSLGRSGDLPPEAPPTTTPPALPRKKWSRREQKARADLLVQQMHDKGFKDRNIATAIQDATGVGRRTAFNWLRSMREQWRVSPSYQDEQT